MPAALLTHTQATWHYRGGSPDVHLPPDLLEATNGQEVLARLLYNRGIHTKAMAQEFLKSASRERLRPVQELADADVAIERIVKAIEQQESILIFGDFDVDGLTGTSIFYETLHHYLGANVSYYIPDRATEGHGLNTAALLKLKSSRQVKLIITTDTGITNFKEVALMSGFGVDTIVTDHHELPEHLPLALANVNPQRLEDVDTHPLGPLSGAGVAFKLCDALLFRLLPEPEALAASNALLDLCAIGLVADMVPLIGENRILVQLGLKQLNTRARLGTRILLEKAGVLPEKPLSAETIGFTIGPRLNALGRLEKATQGVEFLTTREVSVATTLADRLEILNKKRQELCDTTFREAEQQLQSGGGLQGRKAIILCSSHWNPGVIGIVASRLIEKYRLPTFMMVLEDEKQQVRCSARSIPGFHITEHLESMKDMFLHMGGHAGAAGFTLSVEKLETFKNAMWNRAAMALSEDAVRPLVEVDARLGFEYLHPGFCDALDTLGPYGMENPSPIFVMENLVIGAQRHIGDRKNHLKLMLKPSNREGFIKGQLQQVEALLWKCGSDFKLDPARRVHVAFSIEKNTFGQGTTVQLIIKDVLQAGVAPTATIHERVTETAQSKLAQQLQALPSPLPIPQQLSPISTPSVKSSEPQRLWLDERSHPAPDVWVAEQLQHPELGPKTLVFNEGRPPVISFLNAKQVITRGIKPTTPCETLMLWDVPPDLTTFQALMEDTQPERIVLIGGKYRQVPLKLERAAYLKAFYQGVRLLLQNQPEHHLPLDDLTRRFASTPVLVLATLELFHGENTPFTLMGEHVCLNMNAPVLDVANLLANPARPGLRTVETLLLEVQAFRTKLLKAPIHRFEAMVL
jgi:single-stranded-DNA-specific exonuclease RecJ